MVQTLTIHIGGMTCINCQNHIEKKLKKLSGIVGASVDFVSGTAKITYDAAEITLNEINSAIESQGYTISKKRESGKTISEIIGVLIIILALSSLLRIFSTSNIAASFPLAETGMGYGMLLIIGLLTSVHCIAMCGGINLSQTLGKGNEQISNNKEQIAKSNNPGNLLIAHYSLLIPSFLYNGGRLISYTAIGVAVGALGSVITVSDQFRNIILLLAGLFMMIMGINMLGLFPALRRFTPRLPQFLTKKIDRQKTGKGPLLVGILNGFMPCGPLQAMQLYALSTGSPVTGGISMFLFCLGTIPLMFTLGAAGGILSKVKGKVFSQKAMQVGAILVAAMGVLMFSNGWDSAGFTSPFGRVAFFSSASSQTEGGIFEPMIENGVQIVQSTLLPNRYPAITVQQGIPVRWIINAPPGSINGCNNRITIREYGIQYTFQQGENVIEFMPENAGRFRYSCWMSMIRSSITVLAPGEAITSETAQDNTPKPAGVVIPTDTIAIAQIEGNYQAVEINLTDNGFEPAIAVVQQRLPVLWTININSVDPTNNTLLFPAFYTELDAEQGANIIRLIATEDFDFSTANNILYGYMKVVDDINQLDIEAIKTEVANHETLIYPAIHFEEGGQGGCCCGG